MKIYQRLIIIFICIILMIIVSFYLVIKNNEFFFIIGTIALPIVLLLRIMHNIGIYMSFLSFLKTHPDSDKLFVKFNNKFFQNFIYYYNNKVRKLVNTKLERASIKFIRKESASNIKSQYKKLRTAYLETFLALNDFIEAKDPYTAGHSSRVSKYAVKIAQLLKLPARDIKIIKEGALLHDFGKISVPDLILNKKSKLTKKEFLYIYFHPVIGETLIKNIPPLRKSIRIIREHHEKIDGKGYPDGISGDNISFFARIVSIADSYDAMRSNRIYKKALTIKETIAEFEKNKGTQYDAKITEVLLSKLKKNKFFLEAE